MSSTSEFAGKVAIITGAGEGIGKEIAGALVSAGARVLLNDVDGDRAARAAHEIGAAHGNQSSCLPAGGDAGDLTTIQGLVATAVREFGQLDIAIPNAGVTAYSSFLECDAEDFERLLQLNLRGSFFLAQAAARQMKSQGSGGRILLMSSVCGYQAIQYLSAYSMTKAALRMLAKSLAVELSPYGITANGLAPGATITPRNLADDANYESEWSKVIPVRRPATTGDIANAALFLLSPAAAYINGQTLLVDGGWTGVSPTPPMDFVEDD